MSMHMWTVESSYSIIKHSDDTTTLMQQNSINHNNAENKIKKKV